MARPTLNNIRDAKDFATLFRWNVFVGTPGVDGAVADIASGINILCESVDSPPKATNQKIEQNIRGHKIFQPGITQYNNTIQLTCVETVDNKIHTFFKTWREALWTVGSGTRSLQTGALSTKVILQRLDNNDEPCWWYGLFGVFLEDYEPGGSLDGTSSDFLKPSLTFSFDYFKEGPAATDIA